MPTVFITGANRGIGLELAKQYSSDGWKVIATCRDPNKAEDLRALPGVSVHALEVKELDQIDKLAATVQEPIDILIANAGISGGLTGEGQTFGAMDYDLWKEVMDVNVYGAVKTCEAFTPHLLKGQHKKMVAITSKMGSITDTGGGITAYRVSKAALNMALVSSSANLMAQGIAVGVLHPGWVQTDMGGMGAPVTPAMSAEGLIKVIETLEPKPQASFIGFNGEEIPW